MKNNQKGFGAVEGLLLVIIVLLVGFIGYYVYHAQKNTNTTLNNAANTSNASTTSDPTSGWKTFSDNDPTNAAYKQIGQEVSTSDAVPISFKYPNAWTTIPQGTDLSPYGGSGTTANNQVVSKSAAASLSFRSIQTDLSASDYAKQVAGSTGSFASSWKVTSSSTTKLGYTTVTSKLDTATGASYETIVSNKKSAAVFDYANGPNLATYNQIIGTVTLL